MRVMIGVLILRCLGLPPGGAFCLCIPLGPLGLLCACFAPFLAALVLLLWFVWRRSQARPHYLFAHFKPSASTFALYHLLILHPLIHPERRQVLYPSHNLLLSSSVCKQRCR